MNRQTTVAGRQAGIRACMQARRRLPDLFIAGIAASAEVA